MRKILFGLAALIAVLATLGLASSANAYTAPDGAPSYRPCHRPGTDVQTTIQNLDMDVHLTDLPTYYHEYDLTFTPAVDGVVTFTGVGKQFDNGGETDHRQHRHHQPHGHLAVARTCNCDGASTGPATPGVSRTAPYVVSANGDFDWTGVSDQRQSGYDADRRLRNVPAATGRSGRWQPRRVRLRCVTTRASRARPWPRSPRTRPRSARSAAPPARLVPTSPPGPADTAAPPARKGRGRWRFRGTASLTRLGRRHDRVAGRSCLGGLLAGEDGTTWRPTEPRRPGARWSSCPCDATLRRLVVGAGRRASCFRETPALRRPCRGSRPGHPARRRRRGRSAAATPESSAPKRSGPARARARPVRSLGAP